jgi:transcriptional regulator GlxA family with amidase domain
MNEHLRRTLGIDELADTMGISRRHLERLFKRSLGCSPSRHYLDLRLQQARQLLRAGEHSLSDVAGECGFVSVQHFSRCYRQYFGAHPRDHMGASLLTKAQNQRVAMLNAPATSRASALAH